MMVVMSVVMTVVVMIVMMVVMITRREDLRENSAGALPPQGRNDKKPEHPEADHLYPGGLFIGDCRQLDTAAFRRPEIDQPSEAGRGYGDGNPKFQGSLSTV